MSPRRSNLRMRSVGARGAVWPWITVGTAALAVAAGTMFALSPAERHTAQPSSSSGSVGETDRAVASQMSFDVTTTASGSLEARKQIEIRNQLEQTTTIVEVAKEGTQVKKGDVLVRLNSDSIQQQVDEENLKVEAARAVYTVADNDYKIQDSENLSNEQKAKVTVEVAELELKKWQDGEVKSTRQELELALERATRELDRLKEKYELGVSLEKQGFLSRDELKRDEVAYLEAEAALKTATLNQRVYEEYTMPKDEKVKRSDRDQAISELDRVKTRASSELASKDADRKNRREELRIREQRLAKLREQLDMAVILAPQDGLVVYDSSINRDRWGMNQGQTLDVGVAVTKNQRLMVLPDTSVMVAAVRVHESLAGRVFKGQSATVRIDALGGKTISGTVDSVGVIAESGGMRDPNLSEYTVRIVLSEADARMKPSMKCEAQIYLDKVDNALTIPIQAVFSEGLVRYVLVPDGTRMFKRRPVMVGRRSDRFAEVRVGLKPGDEVLVRNADAGELLAAPWDKQELAAVGLKLDETGRVAPLAGAGGPPPGAGMPGGAPGGRPGGRPGGGQRPGGEGGAPTTGGPAAVKPETPAGPGK